jgi:hypothetical protein
MAGNEDKILSAKKWLTRFWGGVWRASEYLSTTHAPPLTHTFIALTLVCVDVRDNTESGDQGDDDKAEAQPDVSKAEMMRAGCGTITKAAMAWSAVRSLVKPPVDVIEHASAVLADATQVAAAWATIPGACRVSSTRSSPHAHTPPHAHSSNDTQSASQEVMLCVR